MLSISFTCSFIFFPILPPSSNSQTKYLAPQKFLFIPVLHIRSLSPKPSGRYLPRVCFICLLVVTYFIFCAQLQSSLKHCDFWAIFLSFFNTIFIKQRQSLSNNDNLYSIVISSLIFFITIILTNKVNLYFIVINSEVKLTTLHFYCNQF